MTDRVKNIIELVEYHFYKRIRLNPGETRGYTFIDDSLYNSSMFNESRFKDISGTVTLKGLEMMKSKKNATDNRVKLATHCLALHKKYGVRLDISFEDFTALYSVLFMEGVFKLDKLESLDKLLSNQQLYNTRLRYIKTNIDYEMILLANPDTKLVHLGLNEQGEDIYKRVKVEAESLDKELSVEDATYTISESLTDDNKLFNYGKKAHYNFFITWFLSNKKDILTDKQNDFFEKLRDRYVPLTDNSKETQSQRKDMFQETEINYDTFRKMSPRIRKRVSDAYKEQFGNKRYPINYSSRNKLRETLKHFVEQADDPDWMTAEERQEKLTQIVIDNYSKEEFEMVIQKNLTSNDKKNIVRAVKGEELLSHRVIRLIKNNIIAYLDKVSFQEVKPIESQFQYSERVFEDLRNKPGKIFSLSTTGEFNCIDREAV